MMTMLWCVDDVIVFNTTPPSYEEDKFWWAHEVMHTTQYGRMGVEKFAYKYMTDFFGIESEADRKGQQAAAQRSQYVSNMGAIANALARGVNVKAAPQTGYKGQFMDSFIAQCVFPGDPRPVCYMLTQSGRIIAVDMFNGHWLHIGWATPPRAQGIAWTYETPNLGMTQK